MIIEQAEHSEIDQAANVEIRDLIFFPQQRSLDVVIFRFDQDFQILADERIFFFGQALLELLDHISRSRAFALKDPRSQVPDLAINPLDTLAGSGLGAKLGF